MKYWGFTILLLVFLTIGFSSQENSHTQADVVKEVFADFNGQTNFDIFLNAPEVTVQRLHIIPGQGDSPYLSDYRQDSPVLLTASQTGNVRLFLQKPSSYDWEGLAKCGPQYGLLFNFHSGQKVIRIALCLDCHKVGIFNSDNSDAKHINMETQLSGHGGSVATVIAKSLFPDDKEIQGLP